MNPSPTTTDAPRGRWAPLLLLFLIAGGATANASPSAVHDVADVLDRLHAAAAQSATEAYFGLFAPDAVFVGTDVAERWDLAQFRRYAEPLFAKGRGWVYTVRERHISVGRVPCGCVAWFDEVLDNAKYGTSRGTGMLLRTADGWRIEQYALTFPLPNDLAEELTRRIRDFEHPRQTPAP